jgi:hypothetical protein
MSVEPNRRIANWALKSDTGRVMQTVSELRPEMLKRYAEATAQLCAMEIGVKKLLDEAGVHTICYVAYLNYARQLYKLSRRRNISGNSFALASRVLKEKWQNRGLNPAVLDVIRKQAFGVTEP